MRHIEAELSAFGDGCRDCGAARRCPGVSLAYAKRYGVDELVPFRALAMTDPIHFHTDLYRRDAFELVAEKYHAQGAHRAGRHPAPTSWPGSSRWRPRGDAQALRDEFCNEAFSATARRLRDLGTGDARTQEPRGAASERAAVGAAGAVHRRRPRSASAGCSSR